MKNSFLLRVARHFRKLFQLEQNIRSVGPRKKAIIALPFLKLF
jgi:hypothetical protein